MAVPIRLNRFPITKIHDFPPPNIQFPHVKYSLSPTKVVQLPVPSSTVPQLKYHVSPGGNEHIKEHHANQKFGWHPNLSNLPIQV